jgi:uncharacterized protein
MSNTPIALSAIMKPVYTQMLEALLGVLAKAEQFAEHKKIDPAVLLNARLAPDMFALGRQIQIACDGAKAAVARAAGIENPKHEDNEISMADFKARIHKVLAFINSVPDSALDGREQAGVEIPLRDRKLAMAAGHMALHWSFPNFFFHVTTAYNILRHNGVELGKADFLGKVQ